MPMYEVCSISLRKGSTSLFPCLLSGNVMVQILKGLSGWDGEPMMEQGSRQSHWNADLVALDVPQSLGALL